MIMQKRLNVFFSGMVQGVGFRFMTEKIARQFSVTGFVRNLPNGKVEVLAEAEEQVLQEFLNAICESHLAHYIRDIETSWAAAEGNFQHFSVRA